MNQKFLIILFCTIFYNGVTSSSKEQLDVKSPEEKLLKTNSLVNADVKKKVEPTPIVTTSTDHLVSASPNVATLSQQTKISTAPNASTSVPIFKDNSTETVKNENLDYVNQNKTKVADNDTSSHAVESKNITSSNDVPASNNSHGFSSTNAPLTSADVTTSSTTTISATISTTTNSSVRATVKPDPVSTVPPSPALTTKVITEQNTPAPSEKHFDGPSFVGGIVLAVGVIAIGFIAFKYYKSGKIDMSYRTL